jgi:hypothetical protein
VTWYEIDERIGILSAIAEVNSSQEKVHLTSLLRLNMKYRPLKKYNFCLQLTLQIYIFVAYVRNKFIATIDSLFTSAIADKIPILFHSP